MLRLDRRARSTHVRCRDRMYLFCLLPAQLARVSRAAHPVQDHSHETLAPCRRVALADVSVLHGGSPEVGPCGPSFGSRKSKSRAHWLGPAPRMTRRSACSNQIPAIAASLRRRSACFRPKTGFRMFRWNGGIAAISGQESRARHLGAYQARQLARPGLAPTFWYVRTTRGSERRSELFSMVMAESSPPPAIHCRSDGPALARAGQCICRREPAGRRPVWAALARGGPSGNEAAEMG